MGPSQAIAASSDAVLVLFSTRVELTTNRPLHYSAFLRKNPKAKTKCIVTWVGCIDSTLVSSTWGVTRTIVFSHGRVRAANSTPTRRTRIRQSESLNSQHIPPCIFPGSTRRYCQGQAEPSSSSFAHASMPSHKLLLPLS